MDARQGDAPKRKRRLTGAMQRALLAFRAHVQDAGTVPSFAELGRRMGVSRQRAQQQIVELKYAGCVVEGGSAHQPWKLTRRGEELAADLLKRERAA